MSELGFKPRNSGSRIYSCNHHVGLSQGWQTMAHGLNVAHHLFLYIRFYYYTAMPILLSFYTVLAKLSGGSKDWMTHRAWTVCRPGLYRRRFPTPAVTLVTSEMVVLFQFREVSQWAGQHSTVGRGSRDRDWDLVPALPCPGYMALGKWFNLSAGSQSSLREECSVFLSGLPKDWIRTVCEARGTL